MPNEDMPDFLKKKIGDGIKKERKDHEEGRGYELNSDDEELASQTQKTVIQEVTEENRKKIKDGN